MADYKITIDGFEVTANSAEDVLALVRAMGGAKAEAPKTTEKTISRHADTAISFLSEIANNEEVNSDSIQKVLNVEAKGVGPKTKSVNNILEYLDFDVDDVYTTERDADGRTWTAGPKIREAIKAIKDAS